MGNKLGLSIALPMLFTACILLFCAHQGTPGGGPHDTVPPKVVSTLPEHGMTDVKSTSPIEINFSKWIAPASAIRSVSVYPALEDHLDVDVSGRRLSLNPSSPLNDSTTYHILIDASLQDLRGNSLGETFDLIFSTGPNLDSASLEGCVAGAPFSTRPKAALFSCGPHWDDSLYFSAPDYLAGVDSSGFFSFDNISPGKYRLLAFKDRNNDGKLQSDEICYTPLDSVVYIADTVNPFVELHRSDADTSALRITNLRAHSGTVLRGILNKPVDEEFKNIELSVKPVSDTGALPVINRLFSFPHRPDFILLLEEPMQNIPYNLTYSVEGVKDSVRFNGTSLIDTTSPKLLSFFPQTDVDLDPRLYLVWSEPVMADSSALILKSEYSDTVELVFSTGLNDTTQIKTSRRLKPETEYSLFISAENIKDLAGNTLKDTGMVGKTLEQTFQTLPADSIALKLHGFSECISPDPQRTWFFKPFGSDRVYMSDDHDGFFVFDSIPAAKGNIGWFFDYNKTGRHESGRLVPWSSPEPYVTLRDTVEARARWEVENIQVDACGVCGGGHPENNLR